MVKLLESHEYGRQTAYTVVYFHDLVESGQSGDRVAVTGVYRAVLHQYGRCPHQEDG